MSLTLELITIFFFFFSDYQKKEVFDCGLQWDFIL